MARVSECQHDFSWDHTHDTYIGDGGFLYYYYNGQRVDHASAVRCHK